MFADILSERGYSVTWQVCDSQRYDCFLFPSLAEKELCLFCLQKVLQHVPSEVDPITHKIKCDTQVFFEFHIRFERPTIRSSDSNNLNLSRILSQ